MSLSSSFRTFLRRMAREEPFFAGRLRSHFGQEPATLPFVSESFAEHEHPDLQRALDGWLTDHQAAAELLGIIDQGAWMGGLSLAKLVAPELPAMYGGASPAEGPVQYANVVLGDDHVLTCVQRGLYLVSAASERLAVLVQGSSREQGIPRVTIEVMGTRRESAEAFLRGLRAAMRQRSVYRGHVLSLSQDIMGGLRVTCHNLPGVDRTGVILPDGLLERIERQTINFSKHSAKLKAAGRHLKRGILFHGPPGTGKTLTAMYLAGAIREQTVLLLTGRGLGLIEQSCAMARALQPALIILEDVDLVAEERTHQGGCAGPLLFELLNAMDGLAEDADILFVLTTNRPELLEPALASRPGRVDQAILVPLPDDGCRRRLFDLYGKGLTLNVSDMEPFVQRTKGASAAFIRELMRRAALFAADDTADGAVADRHFDMALHELVVEGGDLTKSLLGFRTPREG